MNIERIKEKMSPERGLEATLGMEFFSTPDDETCMGQLHVDRRTTQPFGFLSGGATMALAETLAGVGSATLRPDAVCVGINVSGNHISTAKEGETVTATARIIHQGAKTHVWSVEVRNEDGRLVSTVNVTNMVLTEQQRQQP